MPWTGGRYYYRSVRENGKPRRVYVGTAAEAAAEEDRKAREERDLARSRMAQLRAEHAALDTELTELYRLADTLSRAALYAAGFHQHCKGDWRPKRGFHRD
jgi:hypothetical protein